MWKQSKNNENNDARVTEVGLRNTGFSRTPCSFETNLSDTFFRTASMLRHTNQCVVTAKNARMYVFGEKLVKINAAGERGSGIFLLLRANKNKPDVFSRSQNMQRIESIDTTCARSYLVRRRPSNIRDTMSQIACFANQRNHPYRDHFCYFFSPMDDKREKRKRTNKSIFLQSWKATIRMISKIIELFTDNIRFVIWYVYKRKVKRLLSECVMYVKINRKIIRVTNYNIDMWTIVNDEELYLFRDRSFLFTGILFTERAFKKDFSSTFTV